MEVEIRAKLKNPKKVINKLILLGAVKTQTKSLTDYYFGSIDLYKKIGHSFWIRLRAMREKIELAYKGSTGIDGVYDELEQHLQNLHIAKAMFTKMGLTNEITVHKRRTSYKLDNFSIEVDKFTNWGTFIEAEFVGNNTDKLPAAYAAGFCHSSLRLVSLCSKNYIHQLTQVVLSLE